MNIEEFIGMFDDIIPYRFKLKVGGVKSNSIITDKNLISSKNRKGRVYPFYRKNSFGIVTDYISEYIPLEEINVPVELDIECLHQHSLKWEEMSKSTNKKNFGFEVRVLNEEGNKQYGYLSLDLTPAGDIDNKFCSFSNEEGTHEITQYINYKYNDQAKQVIPMENLSFIFYNFESGLEEKVSFHKENGILKGITINKQKLKNHRYDSIVWSDDEVKEKNEFFSRYCNNAKVEYVTPLVCDMTNYIINKDFTNKLEELKHLRRELTYEGDPRFDHLDYDEIRKRIEYLSDPKNDIFAQFYGEYIGNTVIKQDSKLILIIETLEGDYHYFTYVDITNTNAFDVDFYHDRNYGASYYQAIENSDKKPMFRTKIDFDDELLVPLGDQITDDEERAFKWFKSYCMQSLWGIASKKLSVLNLNKYSKKEQGNGTSFIMKRSDKKDIRKQKN